MEEWTYPDPFAGEGVYGAVTLATHRRHLVHAAPRRAKSPLFEVLHLRARKEVVTRQGRDALAHLALVMRQVRVLVLVFLALHHGGGDGVVKLCENIVVVVVVVVPIVMGRHVARK